MLWLRQARLAVLDLVFPPRCAGCGRAGDWFCPQCQSSLHRIQPPICGRCGQELQSSPACTGCQLDPLPPYLNGLRAVAHFDGPLRDAIHALKYQQLTAASERLGDLLCDYLSAHPLSFDVVIPVPLHAERQAERGYNQSALLADVIVRRTNKAADWRALVRTRDTVPQVGLDESERRKNLVGAFACVRRVDGAQVLLVDDVCTTGSTLRECAAALNAAGALTIWGLTLAR